MVAMGVVQCSNGVNSGWHGAIARSGRRCASLTLCYGGGARSGAIVC